MNATRFRLAASAAALLVCGFAYGQDVDPDILKAQAGTYLVAPEDGGAGCRLTLETGEAIGGYSLSGQDSCMKPLPVVAEAYSWNFDGNGGVILIDATRKVLARFVENEGSPMKTEDGAALLLIAAPDGVDRLPTVSSLAGTWTMQRPDGERLCGVTLNSDVDADGNALLSLSEDCAANVARLKLAVWHIEGFGLTLMSLDGSSLGFDMRADGNFDKSKEEGGKPLSLVRR
ncbi:AprI/Inh family metalloprotease inhibitor [Rhizobium ruizarguesonis]|uniref:Metalloprotease n=1 Tax=Rhizobium ruizarguesonis TaxID=2081791 RepID=A0AB38I4F2_9HYPH|nr:AprI/Inh family metalloprotease inhibitor [Rhizobium ruizarguesonis]NEI08077.1 AprI/Inh family metalloprotease inhibitor [Rhizobium ruizarguesonis]NEI29774.1 AprI/Inh family metalloprotease inhibitor [Rhizobium ruizarguesonis]TAY93341.1 metalloprotease [Rhizobium ruizarguesonis]TAZ77979.1 metalloprotease [Rhizobium ruizarguesonis]TBA04354.1 metalloprotease [Rhizobium ruizarguesonis]